MHITTLKTGIPLLLLFGAALGLFLQHRSIVALREANAELQTRLAQQANEGARSGKARVAPGSDPVGLRTESAASKPTSTAAGPVTAPTIAPTKSAVAPGGAGLLPVADTESNRARKIQYRRRYDPFFTQRGFTPEQVDRILDLFILQDDARADLQASVRQVGLRGNAPGVEDLRRNLYAPIVHELQAIMGDDGYATYNRFQSTSFYRVAFVDPIMPAFTSANASLTLAQADLLVAVVAEHDRPTKRNATDIGSESRIDWDGVANRTKTFLSPEQQAALQSHISKENARRH